MGKENIFLSRASSSSSVGCRAGDYELPPATSRFTLADVFEKNEKKNMTTSVYRINENKTEWFRNQGPRFYSSDFDLKIRVLVGIGDGGDVSEQKIGSENSISICKTLLFSLISTILFGIINRMSLNC